MEKVIEKYHLLVRVEIVHDDFGDTTDRTAQWLRVEPTGATRKLMQKNYLTFRYFQAGFGIFSRIVPTPAPAPPTPLVNLNNQTLAFRLGFASGKAAVRTALATKAGQKYRFGNAKAQAAGQVAGTLTLPVPVRVNGQTYRPGEIVQAGGTHQVAKPDFTVAPPSVQWRDVPAGAYVTSKDQEAVADPAALELEKSDWGLLTLTLSNALGATYSLLNGNILTAPTFHIHFGKM